MRVELDGLLKFNVGLDDKERILYAEAGVRLTERDGMERLLRDYQPLMKGLTPLSAAVYFCNQLANAALALQYAVSVHGKSFDLSLDNVTIQLFAHESGYCGVAFKLGRWGWSEAPADRRERREWLRQAYARFYGETIRPLYETAAIVVGANAGQMWGLLPTRFNYFTELWMTEAAGEETKAIIAEDHKQLAYETPAVVFGRDKNPFDVKIRWIEDLKDPCKQLRMKNGCCHYFQTEGGSYCFTCPRLKESEREQRRLQARLAVPAAT